MTPEALRRRMAHGNIYPAEKVDAALANYFREGNLGALRELALLWVADRVDEALQSYREAHGIAQPWETRERVVVAITGAPGGDDVIRRAAPHGARPRGELLGVHVRPSDGLRGPSGDALGRPARAARGAGRRVPRGGQRRPGRDAGAVRPERERDPDRARRQPPIAVDAPAPRLGDQQRHPRVGPIDVHVISAEVDDHGRAPERGDAPRRRADGRRGLAAAPAAGLDPRHRRAAAAHARPGATSRHADAPERPAAVPARRGGRGRARRLRPGVRVARSPAFLLANWFFTPPYYKFTIAEGENLVALVVFLVVAGVVSLLVATASRAHGRGGAGARRSRDAGRAERHAVGVGRPACRSWSASCALAFEADGVAVPRAMPAATSWQVRGERRRRRARATRRRRRRRSRCRATTCWSLRRRTFGDDDREVLHAFAGQVAIAVQQRELRAEADRAAGLAEANELRTALLRGGLARPAHAAVVDQGVGEQPAAARRRLHARPRPGSCSRPSTRRPTGSTT